MSKTLTQASRQWATRPDDERFLNLHDLFDKVDGQRRMSAGKVLSNRQITVAPAANDEVKGIQIIGPQGGAAVPTHWSFGQLATLAGAPAGYLRSLPAPIAADALNYGLRFNRDVEDVGLLVTKDGDDLQMRAATGPRYGRIWNTDVVQALINNFGDGRTGKFRVPGEFGRQVEVTKANTTIYGSDRNIFVFLADEENRIHIDNRRNGESGSLARGFFAWNSEVGSDTMGVCAFLFDYVCMNRIVWGVEEVKEIRLRHTAGAPDRWIEQVRPLLVEYANSSAGPVEAALRSAQQKKLDDVEDFLAKRFTKSVVSQAMQAHIREEGRPIETMWDAVTGLTAYAKSINFQDDRVAIERGAGKLLDLAA